MTRLSAPAALLVVAATLAAGCFGRDRSLQIRDADQTRVEVRRLYDSYRDEFPGVKSLSAGELVELRAKEDVVLVDVREEKERAVSVIPGAITREAFEAEKEKLRERRVVAYCTIGYRSGKYVQELNEQGIPALNLEGSILAWVNAGQPVVDPQGAPVKRVHTYGAQWALLPDGYEAVY